MGHPSDAVSANVAMLSRPKHAVRLLPGEIVEFKRQDTGRARPKSCSGCGAPLPPRGWECSYCRRVAQP